MTPALSASLSTQFRTIDGLSIRFAESESRNTDALLLRPWPESVFAYEPIWSRLAEHTQLVAIDLPGFGHSEGRDALMSPRAMGEFVVRVADAFGLERPQQSWAPAPADSLPPCTREAVVEVDWYVT